MYRHILVPVDGSRLSLRAVQHAVELARRVNAKIAGLAVITPWSDAMSAAACSAASRAQYERNAEVYAASSLLAVSDAASAGKVGCSVVQLKHARPWRAIIDAAKSMRCDLVVMATHGRQGVDPGCLSSETQKVLAHSTVPVLVYRDDVDEP